MTKEKYHKHNVTLANRHDNINYDLGAIQVLRNAIFLEIGPPPTPS